MASGERAYLVGFVFLLGIAARAPAQMALPEALDFSNSTEVGDEPETARLAFYRAEEHLAAGRAREAGEEVMRLLRGATHGRVRVGERLVVPLETAALFFLLRLPPDVQSELARADAELTGASLPGTEPAALRAFAARHPLLESAERAQLDAGVRELLTGRFGAAAADLERLVHWPMAGPGTTRLLAAARLLEAQRRLRAGAPEGPLARWPEGQIAAGDGEARSIADWRRRTQEAVPARPDFGDGLPQFERLWKPAPTTLAVRDPEYSLHRSRFKPVPHQDPNDEPELKDLPTRAPVVVGDRLITLEPIDAAEGGPVVLRVRQLATGADCFPPLRSDFDFHLPPDRHDITLDRAALAVDGEALYVALELREPNQSGRELQSRGESAQTALLKIDLAREGFIEWRVTSAELAADESLRDHVLVGAPAICDGRVLIAASRLRVKETECALLAFDAATGAPAGAVFLARAAAIARDGNRFGEGESRRVNPSPAVVRDGTAYVCTNLGVIAAVRARDLELAWLFRYHRAIAPDNDRYSRPARFDLGPWLGRPPVVLPDRMLATPSDSHYLYALARWPSREGHLLLEEPIEKQKRWCLLHADATRCFFLTSAQDPRLDPVYAVEATDHAGAPLWTEPQRLPVTRGNLIVGTPAATDRWLFLPTDRNLYRVDLATGLLASLPPPREAGLPYPEFGCFGDLAIAGDRLVSTSTLFTMVFAPTAR
ncbi:MAG: hypothetical protein EXS13_03635 [Planctomycetes bacterium]|nr:hypothetical protein [Planctomycetota bacterium]